jgi:urease accessory protein
LSSSHHVATSWPGIASRRKASLRSLALDSPPEALALVEANLTVLGTALGTVLLLLALLQGTARLRQRWQHIGARIAGSWIAATAILVLALRLVR